MSRNDAQAAERAVLELARRLNDDPRLRAEIQRARREFFGQDPGAAAGQLPAAAAAERRFAEWYALERDSERLGAVPVEVPELAHDLEALQGSQAGVYAVTAVHARGVEAKDLQDGGVVELLVPKGSLLPGDLVVGRLFALAGTAFVPSVAAAVFRPGTPIGAAFQRDLQRLEIDRRLQQIELEHLLLRRTDQSPSPTAAPAAGPAAGPAAAPRAAAAPAAPGKPREHLEAELDQVLAAGGSPPRATDISEQLAEAARPGPVIGPLLDDLAFHTRVDLDRVRALCLELWNASHPGADAAAAEPPAAPAGDGPPGETLGERLVRTLDEGLRQRRDVDDLFAQLERMAGLEPGAADDGGNPFDDAADAAEEEEDPADRDELLRATGDLGPLVAEYLWETGREQDPAAAALRLWVELQGQAAAARLDLEQVSGDDLQRVLLHVYLGAAPGSRAAAVAAAHRALQDFYAWAATAQELEVGGALQGCGGALLDQRERLDAAGSALSTAPAGERGGPRPGLLQVEDLGPQGFGVRDDDGGHHWLGASPAALAQLRVGDLLVGAIAAGRTPARLQGLVVVLPAEAKRLLE